MYAHRHPSHQTSTTQDIHRTVCKIGHLLHQISTTPCVKSTTSDIRDTRHPPHRHPMFYFTHDVVGVWCGGCRVWYMSFFTLGVVDVFVVDVLQSLSNMVCLFVCFICNGRMDFQIWMFFWKNSKRPLTPPPPSPFLEITLRFFLRKFVNMR